MVADQAGPASAPPAAKLRWSPKVADAYSVQAKAQAVATRAHPWNLTMDDVWASAVVLLSVAIGLMSRLGSVDLAYHVRAGTTMLSSGHLPRVDTFTFTAAGRAWLDQQWLAQVIIALGYRVGGWSAVAILHAALVGTTFWFLWLACRARGTSARTSSVLTLCGLVVSFLYTGMRPQTIAYPLFTATLWILAGRRTHPRRLLLLPPLVAVWANLHGSFVLAPVMIGLTWLEDRRDHRDTSTPTLVVGIASLLATLLSPYGIGVWRYAIGITTNTRVLGTIQEWQATSIRTLDGALFFLSVLAVVAYLVHRDERTDTFALIWLGTFFLLSLPAQRGLVWWGFVFPVVIAGLATGEPGRATRPERRGSPSLNAMIVLALVAFVAVELPWARDRIDPASGSSILLRFAPQDLVDATARSVRPTARVFVSQPIASWFEFALPSNPVFVDSRIELFSGRVWDDYQDVMEGREGWQATLDRWQVDAVVLQDEDTVLGSRIADDPGWRLVVRNDDGALYVRA